MEESHPFGWLLISCGMVEGIQPLSEEKFTTTKEIIHDLVNPSQTYCHHARFNYKRERYCLQFRRQKEQMQSALLLLYPTSHSLGRDAKGKTAALSLFLLTSLMVLISLCMTQYPWASPVSNQYNNSYRKHNILSICAKKAIRHYYLKCYYTINSSLLISGY